jgi:cytochrome bd-type quinol oxidase subunit 1
MFTLLGFMGLYLVLGILFVFLIQREIGQGPSQPGSTIGTAAPMPAV